MAFNCSRSRTAALALRPSSGFSLIELIISIVLLGFLAAIGTTMISDSFDTTRLVNSSQSSAGQARYALERMEREIREVAYSGSSYTIATMDPTRLVFTKSDGVTVTINSGGANLAIAYPTSATPATLSNQVSNFALAYYRIADDGSITSSGVNASNVRFVEIKLTLTDSNTSGQSIAQRTRIALRNAS